MIIRYIGTSTVRLIEGYSFSAANGMVNQITDQALLENLLTLPGVDFAVDATDPLAQIVGADRAAELVLEGITTPAEYRSQRPRKVFIEEVGNPAHATLE
jgi:hypothetical protein